MRSLAILSLILTSLDICGCSTVQVSTKPQRPFYNLNHQARAHRTISIQFIREIK